MIKEAQYTEYDKYFSYKNKRDFNGKLISYKAQKLCDELADLSLELINNYETIKKIKKVIPSQYIDFYFRKKIYYKLKLRFSHRYIIFNYDNEVLNKNNESYNLKYTDLCGLPVALLKKILKLNNNKVIINIKDPYINIVYLKIFFKNFIQSIKRIFYYFSIKQKEFDKKKYYLGIAYQEGINSHSRSDFSWLNGNNIKPSNIIYYVEHREAFNDSNYNKKDHLQMIKSGLKYIKVWEHEKDFIYTKNKFFFNFEKPEDNIEKWIVRELKILLNRCNYWYKFFYYFNIIIHSDPNVDFTQYGDEVIAKHISIEKLNGCSFGKLRSYPNMDETAFYGLYINDLFFLWGKDSVDRIKLTKNYNNNLIITGYVWGGPSKETLIELDTIKKKFNNKGVKKLILFVDSMSQSLGLGQKIYKDDYESFYLNILQLIKKNNEVGLLLKPKKPKKNLFKYDAIMKEINNLDRCILSKNERLDRIKPSDYATICDFVVGIQPQISSAFVESIIICKNGVFYDYGNIKENEKKIYSEVDKDIISNNQSKVIEIIDNYINNKSGLKNYCDWSKFINSFDTFNDGRGNYRMGEYLNYIFDAYKKNLDKKQIIDLANKKYSKVYGNELIFN